MSPADRTRVGWLLGVLAVCLIVIALTGGGCARQSESDLWRVVKQAQ